MRRRKWSNCIEPNATDWLMIMLCLLGAAAIVFFGSASW